MRCDQFNDFYEHDHGYVFNRQQLEQLINNIRVDTINECAKICFNLADLSKPNLPNEEFKAMYIFAGDKIRELQFENLGNK